MTSLQSGNPNPLTLVAVVAGSLALEERLQDEVEALGGWIKGEWFLLSVASTIIPQLTALGDS